MGCRTDYEDDTAGDLRKARERIKELERQLCECRSILYVYCEEDEANSQDKKGIKLEDRARADKQLALHREHREEEKKEAIESRKKKVREIQNTVDFLRRQNVSIQVNINQLKRKSSKKRKRNEEIELSAHKQKENDIKKVSLLKYEGELVDKINEIEAIDSDDDEFWDREHEAFCPYQSEVESESESD